MSVRTYPKRINCLNLGGTFKWWLIPEEVQRKKHYCLLAFAPSWVHPVLISLAFHCELDTSSSPGIFLAGNTSWVYWDIQFSAVRSYWILNLSRVRWLLSDYPTPMVLAGLISPFLWGMLPIGYILQESPSRTPDVLHRLRVILT